MRYLISIIFILGITSVAHAQSDTSSFTISVFGSTDSTPPTTPTLLSATPAAATQIDLSWSSSTDGFSVSGYVVTRDGSDIATTTQLSYADTGLNASTTYAYSVRAFDPSSNYSSSSNSIATTTLATSTPSAPSPAADEGATEGTAARVVVDAFAVHPGVATTTLQLQTARPSRIEVRWGRTGAYELGYLVKSAYSKDHAVTLTELEPGTTYEYEVVGYTQHGVGSVLKSGSFTTNSPTRSATPMNVQQFQAAERGDDVALSWRLPEGESVGRVRIVRSHYGFPLHPRDGAVVYQGSSERAVDTGVLASYSPVYYTAFLYNESGAVSSGAVAIVYKTAAESPPPSAPRESSDDTVVWPPQPGTDVPEVSEATSSIVSDRLTPEMKMPDPVDIYITQGAKRFSLADRAIALDPAEAFTISIPREVIAGNLKSIILTIADPTDNRQGYSFLLRINRDQSAYEATIAPLQVAGESQLTLEVYDYEAAVVATYRAPLDLVMPPPPKASAKESDAVLAVLQAPWIPWLLFGLGVFAAVLLVFLLRRRRQVILVEDND